MKREWKLFAGTLLVAVMLASGVSVFCQKKAPTEGQGPVQREKIFVSQEGQHPPPGDTFMFVSSEMNFDGKVVKGAPYSAQAVSESTQMLTDGNRIVNKSTTAIYRDSEGRTRREQSLGPIGMFANSGEAPEMIFINDPVAGVNYALDSRTHVARKMAPMSFGFIFDRKTPPPAEGGAPPAEGSVRTEKREMVFKGTAPPEGPPGDPLEGYRIQGNDNVMVFKKKSTLDHMVKESLGKQTIEGVVADGVRFTLTIPAGEIGNERPIVTVEERWYSPELQVMVMTRHSDPRFGETVYRLTNIDRSEPTHSLFEVPADYTIKSTGKGAGMGMGMGIGAGVGVDRGSKPISRGVLNAKAVSLPAPEYSAIARQAHASGTVKVQITIDEDGNVTSAQAVSGHPLLQAASVEAARQAKFAPTKLEGQPVRVQGIVTYTFVPE